MKNKNQVVLVVLAALMPVFAFLLYVGAMWLGGQRPYNYPNQGETVVCVEMIHNKNVASYGAVGIGIDPENFYVIRTLGEEEIPELMESLRNMKTKRSFSQPLYGYGEYIFRVTYENGNVEIYGSKNIENIESGETGSGISAYHFAGDAFETLFYEYLDGSYVPE